MLLDYESFIHNNKIYIYIYIERERERGGGGGGEMGSNVSSMRVILRPGR